MLHHAHVTGRKFDKADNKTQIKRKKKCVNDDEKLASIDGVTIIKLKRSRLRRNIDFKESSNVYQCLKCPNTEQNMIALRKHIKTEHYNTAKYKCQFCSKLVWTLSQFIKHQYEEHDIDQRLKCNACDRVFFGISALSNHKKSYHMLGDKLKCTKCEYETYNKQSFSTHKILHLPRSLKCQYCEKSFKRKNGLLMHERVHKGDKRKTCGECGKAFIDRTSLKYHMTRHHPEVAF